METIPPIFLLFLRFSFASLFIFLLTIPQWKKPLPWNKGIILGLLIGIVLLFQNFALLTLGAGRGAFLAYTYSIFIPPLQLLITKKPLHIGSIIGLAITLSGVFIMVSPQTQNMSVGDLFILLSSFLFSFYMILIDKFGKTEPFWPYMSIQFMTVAVISVILSLLFENIPPHLNSGSIYSLLYLIVFGTLIASSIQVYFQYRTTPTRAAIILSLEGVFAALLAYMLGKQHMTSHEIWGACIIIAGVLMCELFPARYTIGKSAESNVANESE